MSVIQAQVATDDVLVSDGSFTDKLVAGIKAPFSAADAVEKSIVLYSTVIYTVAGFCGGVAAESRGVTVPGLSNLLRPKAKRV